VTLRNPYISCADRDMAKAVVRHIATTAGFVNKRWEPSIRGPDLHFYCVDDEGNKLATIACPRGDEWPHWAEEWAEECTRMGLADHEPNQILAYLLSSLLRAPKTTQLEALPVEIPKRDQPSPEPRTQMPVALPTRDVES